MTSSIGRREFLKLTGAGVAVVVVGSFRDGVFASGGGKPNIIFIMAVGCKNSTAA